MSIHKSCAIVLNRFDVRETSLIVHFFTRDYGKITGILKGIRGDPKKFASTVEIFSANEIVFYKRRNDEVCLVSHCDLENDFGRIRGNVAKIGLASMAMEIVNSVMEIEDVNLKVFELMYQTLSELAAGDNPEKVMTIFKIKILALSGFKPHLDSCVLCSQRILGQAKFSLSLGGLLCARCSGRDTSARSIFRGTIATILHIEKNEFKNNLTLGG
jgi:DNA repair protein RecO (recombination protein O)